jgi:heat shock protein HslJ
MRAAPAIALSLAALVLVAACSSGGAATGAPSAAPSASVATSVPPAAGAAGDDLEGRTFIVTGAQGYTIAPGSEIALMFEAGRLGISAGCNQMSGSFEIADGVLVVGSMMSTEMACDEPLMAQDTFMSAFVNGATIALDGDTLTLVRDGVTLTTTDKTVAQPDLPLEDTTWTIDGLITAQAVSSMPVGVTATLAFADGSVAVDAGCNSGSGSAEIGDTTITFGPIATTKMACEGAAMEVEQHVLAVLSGEVAFGIDSDSLELNNAAGGLTAKGGS